MRFQQYVGSQGMTNISSLNEKWVQKILNFIMKKKNDQPDIEFNKKTPDFEIISELLE